MKEPKLFHQVIDGKPTWKYGTFPEEQKYCEGFPDNDCNACADLKEMYDEELKRCLDSAPSVIESDYEKVKSEVWKYQSGLDSKGRVPKFDNWTPEDKAYDVPEGLKFEIVPYYECGDFKQVRIVPESTQTTSEKEGCSVCGYPKVSIRGAIVGQPPRMICPQCAYEKLGQIKHITQDNYGQAYKA